MKLSRNQMLSILKHYFPKSKVKLIIRNRLEPAGTCNARNRIILLRSRIKSDDFANLPSTYPVLEPGEGKLAVLLHEIGHLKGHNHGKKHEQWEIDEFLKWRSVL